MPPLSRALLVTAALAAGSCHARRSTSVPAALEVPDLQKALSLDQWNRTWCASPWDARCVGPRQVLRRSLERIRAGRTMPFRDLEYVASVGSPQLVRATVEALGPRSHHKLDTLRFGAQMGDERACARIEELVSSVPTHDLGELGRLCPGATRALVLAQLAKEVEKIETSPGMRRLAREAGPARPRAFYELTVAAAVLGARDAVPLLQRASATDIAVDWTRPPVDGAFPSGTIYVDAARVRLGDSERAATIRQWLVEYNRFVADIEPIAWGLGAFAEDAPLLVTLADRFHSPGPTEAIVRFVDEADRLRDRSPRWQEGVDTIEARLDDLVAQPAATPGETYGFKKRDCTRDGRMPSPGCSSSPAVPEASKRPGPRCSCCSSAVPD